MREIDGVRSSASRLSYWPEIDGLRTIAVLSVFTFHLSRTWIPGGFVGVDIFFVISGFLICSILLSDIEQGKFSIGKFYQRRISRIFPALILVVCSTMVAGSILYSSQDMASLGISAAAAAASVINMKLIMQGSYFLISQDAQPLLHYWSLSVEEQFYILFPLLLYVVVKYTRIALAIVITLALISFASCVILTVKHPTIAFYSLPTRAWEMLAGSGLALYRAREGTLPLPRLMAWAGFLIILASIMLIEESTGFPGWVAAFPVIGAVLLISSIGVAGSLPLQFLSQPWMVATGKRSYSLYLWHWPVFSFVDYALFQSGDWTRVPLKVGLSLCLAALTYRYVEQPTRRYFNAPARRWPVFAAALLCTGMIVGIGLWTRNALYFDVRPSSIASGGTVVRGGEHGTIVLSGDSQAAMYGRQVGVIAREQSLTLDALGTAGKNQLPGESNTHWPDVAAFIRRTRPDIVILADAWSEKLNGDPAPLRRALDDILQTPAKVILITQPPILAREVSRDGIRHGLRAPYRENPETIRARTEATAIVRTFAGPRIEVVDVSDLFQDTNGGVRLIGANGRLVYYDSTHLSDEGAALVRPRLEAAIRRELEKH